MSMMMLTMVASALGLAVAERAHRQENHAKVVQDNSTALEKLGIFHINLGWECAALPPFGSGIYAAAHCKPGKFKETTVDGIPEWEPDDTLKPPLSPAGGPWTTISTPWKTLVSSCQNTFLHKMKKWNAAKSYDVVTIVEMANPGADGLGKFPRQTNGHPPGDG